MITRLLIKNYAIIENLEIDFSDKLTIITGETGAGKSILLGGLGLIMGKRADLKALFDNTKKCIIEGYFDVSKYSLKSFFTENDIDFDDELIIRREITPSGKSRAFINDTPTSIKLLQQLSANLIDLHQQFDTLDIHNVSFQLRMIDALAGNTDLLETYQKEFKQYQSDQRKLQKLLSQSQAATKETDFLTFQLNELTEATLHETEQETLETEQTQLNNSEDIKRVLGGVYQQLNDADNATLDQLQSLMSMLHQVQKFNPTIEQLYERLNSTILELEDISSELEQLVENTAYNPERLQEIQERLDLIYRLQNKHQVRTTAELLGIQQRLETKLEAYSDLSGEISILELSIEQQEKDLRQIAEQLSIRRKKIVQGFEQKVHELLAQLSMPYAQLKVDIQTTKQLNATGLDEVNFLFASNKGSRFDLIKNVASGGELSRLTLCTKSLVASAIPLPTLIFDEIDTGISGDVALKMGQILKDLSDEHQVVSITHTPQIAVNADSHYFVYKQIVGERTTTSVKALNQEERINEIATMLSGSPPSEAAISNARALMKK